MSCVHDIIYHIHEEEKSVISTIEKWKSISHIYQSSSPPFSISRYCIIVTDTALARSARCAANHAAAVRAQNPAERMWHHSRRLAQVQARRAVLKLLFLNIFRLYL